MGNEIPTAPLGREIPQSNLLEEARVDSLAEVMSRDPEQLSRQNRDQIIAALREQRGRIAAAEAAGSKPRTPKAAAGVKSPLSSVSTKSLDDLGI